MVNAKGKKKIELFSLTLVNSANFKVGFFFFLIFFLFGFFSYLPLRPEFQELSDDQKS